MGVQADFQSGHAAEFLSHDFGFEKSLKPIETEQVSLAPQSPLSPRASSTPAIDKILPPALQPREQLFPCQSSSPSNSPVLRISSCLWVCATSCRGELLTAKPLHLLCSCSAKSGSFPCVLAVLSRGTKLAALSAPQSPSWPEGLALASQLQQLLLASNYNSMPREKDLWEILVTWD